MPALIAMATSTKRIIFDFINFPFQLSPFVRGGKIKVVSRAQIFRGEKANRTEARRLKAHYGLLRE
jgi:hypothetical protein